MPPVLEPVGEQLRRVRTSRRSREGEARYPGRELSRDVLARRTGTDGYPTVASDTIKSAEESAKSGSRVPGDDTLASLYHALEATPDEFPGGAMAQVRYLLARWLDEQSVDLGVALQRREQALALLPRPIQDLVKGVESEAERIEAQPPSDAPGRQPNPGKDQAA